MLRNNPGETFRSTQTQAPSRIPRWLTFALLGVLFAVSSYSINVMNASLHQMATVWLTNALVVAAALRMPTKDWKILFPLAFAVMVGVNLMFDRALVFCVASPIINLAEIALTVFPLRQLGVDRNLSNPMSLVVFYVVALGPAIGLSAVLAGAFFSVAIGADPQKGFWVWYAADAMGLVTLAPLACMLRLDDTIAAFTRQKLAGTIGLVLLLLCTLAVMRGFNSVPLAFLLFPTFLLITLFRGYPGIAFAATVAGTVTIANLSAAHGYLSTSSLEFREKLFVLQLFIAVLSATSLFFESILAERRSLIQKLREASTLALAARDHAESANLAKSNFLANMSHELRTPLNAILGYSEIMRDGVLKPICEGECREHSKIVHGAGSHLLSLINDILDMSKIEAGKFDLHLDRVDVRAAVRDCVGLMDVRAKQGGLQLDSAVPDMPQEMMADERALRQIVLNLLSNAIKFTPAGGTVSVSLRQANDVLVLAVRDTGVGIPAKDLPRLGIPFEQVRRSSDVAHSGTGLGLALVSALAQKHGGGMSIESEEGVGTAVTITLPRKPASAAEAAPLAAE
jgi:signal transduction histidine kinase